MIKELIRKVGRELKSDFNKLDNYEEKERFHLVTKSDESTERFLIG